MQFDRMMFLLAPLWGATDLIQLQFPEVFASLKPPANGCNSFGVFDYQLPEVFASLKPPANGCDSFGVFDYQLQMAIASIHPDRGFKPIAGG